MLVWDHDIEDLSEHFHDLCECIGAVLKLPVSQVRAFKQRADLKEELERVFLRLHVRIVTHLSDKLSLYALKIVAKYVIKDGIVKL